MNFDNRAELTPEVGPPIVLRTAAPDVRPQILIFVDEVIQSYGLARCSDDRRDCRLVLRAKAFDEEILKIAKCNAAIDRSSGSKSDDERIGTARGALCAVGRVLDGRKALLERCDTFAFLRGGLFERRRCQSAVRLRRHLGLYRRLRPSWFNAEKLSSRMIVGQPPNCSARTDEEQDHRGKQPRAPPQAASRAAPVHFGSGLLHSIAARASSASSVGSVDTATDFQPV